ncbi:cytochrome c oxidase subunit 7C, mitochondrial-like [Oryx dammah]|uniref:cytochrome c oxidase subunit 7C, mitochondrial-like n=1 Tax=Oryx dammah TaxID=59534 RepID=UPI001A9A911D|nr:cytochrome c oxidase subunit 7C, mitochondrial-like [Oryx dammah]
MQAEDIRSTLFKACCDSSVEGKQGREERSARFAAAVSSAFSLCIFRRASSSAVLGQSVQRFESSVVHRSHYEEGPGKNIPLSVESKWRFLAMVTWFFGFGFAVPFLIVRHQPLKK